MRRQKDIGYHREGYLSLIRFAKKLARAGSRLPERKAALAAQIRAEKYVAEREWLLRKLGS